MVIEEPLNTPRRPLWLKITFICFILIIGASVVSIVTKREDIRNEILVMPSLHNPGCLDDSTDVNLFAKSLFIINPLTASNDNLVKSFKLSFESEPKRLRDSFCSVVWKNSVLFFGAISPYGEVINPRQITMLTGCKLH